MRFWTYIYRMRVAAIACGLLVSAFGYSSYEHVLDVELPSRDRMSMDKDQHERDNRDAYDRVNEGSRDSKDLERAREHSETNPQ
jgi:hypothetical protein